MVYGSRSPAGLFRDKAIEVRKTTGVRGPAFNPFEYAEKLGISVEEKDNMVLDGLLTCDARGHFEVSLKKDVHAFRKNFTLAHEIAHTFFYGLLASPNSFRGNLGSDPEEERLCDIAAAELLMPFSTFKADLFKDDSVTPHTLFSLMNLYKVSLEAVSIRTVTVSDNLACAFWELDGPAVRLRSVVPSTLQRWTLCQTRESSVELALLSPGRAFTKSDSFYGAKERGRVRRKVSSYCFRPNRALSVIEIRADEKFTNVPKAVK